MKGSFVPYSQIFSGFNAKGPETLQNTLTLFLFCLLSISGFGPIWPEMYLEAWSEIIFSKKSIKCLFNIPDSVVHHPDYELEN